MNRDQLVSSTYEAAFELNRLKAKYGLVNRKAAIKIENRIEQEKIIVNEIDNISTIGNEREREQRMKNLMRQFDSIGHSTLCKKDEMNWPSKFLRFNPVRVIKGALTRD